VKTILLGIHQLLREDPNLASPANIEIFNLYVKHQEEYVRRVKSFATRFHSK
jgi:ubiquitin-protein ligase